jgi:hypothetical protein
MTDNINHQLFMQGLNDNLLDLRTTIIAESTVYNYLFKTKKSQERGIMRDFRICCNLSFYSQRDDKRKSLLIQCMEHLSINGDMQNNAFTDRKTRGECITYLRSKGISEEEMLSIREIKAEMFIHAVRNIEINPKEINYAPFRNDQRREAMPAPSEQTVV